jgi:pyruvate ferredoxin oxidoreductase gamma subunit
VLPVDGIGVSQRNGLGRIVNSALLGAFACALEAPKLDTLLRAVAETAPKAGAENAAACLEGYRLVEAQLALQAA